MTGAVIELVAGEVLAFMHLYQHSAVVDRHLRKPAGIEADPVPGPIDFLILAAARVYGSDFVEEFSASQPGGMIVVDLDNETITVHRDTRVVAVGVVS